MTSNVENHLRGINTSSAVPVSRDESHRKKEKKIDYIGLQAIHVSRLTSSSPHDNLNSYHINYISLSENFFYNRSKNSPSLSWEEFNNYSILIIQFLLNSNNLDECHQALATIFNERFSSNQLHQHLRNFIFYLLHIECKGLVPLVAAPNDEDLKKIIDTQLALLSTSSVLQASYWKEGKIGDNFFRNLFLSLEIDYKKRQYIVKNKEKSPESALQKSSKFIGETDPQNIWEANLLKGIDAQEREYAISRAQIMMGATAPIAAPLAVVAASSSIVASAGLATIPLLIGIAAYGLTKLLNDSSTAINYDKPPSISNLSDSRDLNLSVETDFVGREEIIEQIVDVWNAGTQHPILIGLSGVGKSSIIEAISRQIACGKIPGYQEKVAYYGSAAQFVRADKGITHIDRLVNSLLKFKEEVVLALDEFHAFYNDEAVWTALKSVFDFTSRSLRYCIFATTPDDAKRFINDETFRKRFHIIDVKELKDEETKDLLKAMRGKLNPVIAVTDAAIEAIYEKSNYKFNGSRLLLYNSIRAAGMAYRYHVSYDRRRNIASEIKRLSESDEKENDKLDKIWKLKKELSEIEKVTSKQDKIKGRLSFLASKREGSKEISIEKAKQIFPFVNVNSGFTEFQDVHFLNHHTGLKTFLFQKYFNQPILTEFIEKFAEYYEKVLKVTPEFVEKVYENRLVREVENEEGSDYQYESQSSSIVNPSNHSFPKKPFVKVREGEILRGLPVVQNSSGVNAILLFIATTDYFNEMFDKDPPAGMEKLHNFLHWFICSLRKNETIEYQSYILLLKQLQKDFPEILSGKKLNPYDLLIKLTEKLKWSLNTNQPDTIQKLNDSKRYPRLCESYAHKPKDGYLDDELPDGWGRKALHFNFSPIVVIDIPNINCLSKINISNLLEQPQLKDLKPEKIKGDAKEIADMKEQQFEVIRYFTCLPETLNLYLKPNQEDRGMIYGPPLELAKNQLITLNEYEINEDQTVKFVKKVNYRVEAAISYTGEGVNQPGYYVCEIRYAYPYSNDRLVRYDANEKVVEIDKEEEFGKLGFLLRLKRIKEGEVGNNE